MRRLRALRRVPTLALRVHSKRRGQGQERTGDLRVAASLRACVVSTATPRPPSSHRQRRPGPPETLLGLWINTERWLSSDDPNRDQGHGGIPPGVDKRMDHLHPARTQPPKLTQSLARNTETASLTWLMKRLFRFSLTVETKDVTETLHACTPAPGLGWWSPLPPASTPPGEPHACPP